MKETQNKREEKNQRIQPSTLVTKLWKEEKVISIQDI